VICLQFVADDVRHLLGKKSWNVYNPDAIARVRRDEDRARAEQKEDERRQRASESDRRLALLKGDAAPEDVLSTGSPSASKKRKRYNDDETISHETASDRAQRLSNGATSVKANSGLEDRSTTKPAIAGDSQVGVKLSDAYGYGKDGGKTWYSTSAASLDAMAGKASTDVWGNEDPRRQEREKQRMNTDDPLAAMKKGVKQLKQAEVQRAEWKAQRERDLVEIEQMAAASRRKRRNHDPDDLDGFRLDDNEQQEQTTDKGSRTAHRSHRHHHRHYRRHELSERDTTGRSRGRESSHRSHRDRDR
jgi:hypothetical protein